jgi:putative adenylate-forming enzyme
MDIVLIFEILRSLRQLRAHERWTREQLDSYQQRRLEHLRQHVYKHSPFYQEFHRGLMDRPLSELPVLTKAMVMEHFDDLVTDRNLKLEDIRSSLAAQQSNTLYLDRYWVAATSGSTGKPGIFVFSRSEWATIIASFARGQEWAGVKVDLRRHRKLAVVASVSPLHMSFRVGVTANNPFMSTLRLSATDPLPSLVERLNLFQPEILIAYASMVGILAEEQQAGRLRIWPTVIFSSSEVLTNESRKRIEQTWGPVLFNEYAATETGGLAAEYQDHFGMSVSEDLVILEVVDARNRPVPANSYGEKLLVTPLFKRTQPLIRYELHDSVRLASQSGPSGLPFAVIADIQGRTEDTLYFPGLKTDSVAVHPNTFHEIMDTAPVSGWQVLQDATGIKVLVVGSENSIVEEQLISRFKVALSASEVRVPPISVQYVTAIPKTASGKVPLIKSLLPVSE